MAFDAEAITLAGSGLVFINTYDDSVSAAYRNAILAAENYLQSHFTNPVTLSINFTLGALREGAAASNAFFTTAVSYSAFRAALSANATSSDDLLAVAGLPGTDPSQGAGFGLPIGLARILGLAPQTNALDVIVTLNDALPWTYGQDAVGALIHEITEGGMGRIGSLGLQGNPHWAPLDLFRFTADGVRDYTGGADGIATFFGVDSAHLSALRYHNSIDASGHDDGSDLGDWSGVFGDAFGPGGPGAPGTVSATDLQVMDVLGWSSAPWTPAADDFANSLADGSHAFGLLVAGGSAGGTLQSAGDRDWFSFQAQAGRSYVLWLGGHASDQGTLADPYLRLHAGSGALLAQNDDIIPGDYPDSKIVFQAASGGTFYAEAGAWVDGHMGSYTLTLGVGAVAATAGGDLMISSAGGPTVMAGDGDDTVVGADVVDYLRGDAGDDQVWGGALFDDINGNMGNDTGHGGYGDDWVVGGKDNDVLFGDAGSDIVYGNLGSDTCDGGSGADLVRGGQADDLVRGGAGDDWLSGDRGNDTISGGTGADTFHTFSEAGIDRVTDFSAAEGDRVQLDPGTAYTATQVGADTVIDMGAGNQMILEGVQLSSLPAGWIFGA
jgi:Ca2+-binding RTX toxin-like protein